jgi:rhamnosyl/mannosyltransferase
MQRYPVVNAAQLVMLWPLFKDIDAIIVPSPAMIDNVPILAQNREKCQVIPLGIDESLFASDAVNEVTIQNLRQRYGAPLVLFVGRLVYYKGCDVLLKAMKKIDANLVIVGEGPLEGELKHLAENLGLGGKVHFVGRVSDVELAHFYRACDVFVLPSTQKTECYGLVQVEAMLSGVPVVNTSLPTGVPWISQDQYTGLTVPPGDVDELIRAISRLLSDRALRIALGQAGQKRALENFTLRQQIAATSQLYTNILSRLQEPVLTSAIS